MPSQIVTTLGSYATAPIQIVWATFIPSEEWQLQKRLADQIAQNVRRGRHDGTRMCVAKEPFDAGVLRERRSAAGAHRQRRHLDRALAGRRLDLEYTEHRQLVGLREVSNEVVDPCGEP